MKFCNLFLFLLFFFTTANLPIRLCMESSLKIKQDAITSLFIFAKSQAEFQREKQLQILKNHNITSFNMSEFANLLKKTEPINLKKIAETIKRKTKAYNKTNNISTSQIKKRKISIVITNSTNLTKNDNLTKSLNKTKPINHSIKKNIRKIEKQVPKVDKKIVSNSSIHKNITISKNATNSTLPKNKEKTKANATLTITTLHPTIHNKKLIML